MKINRRGLMLSAAAALASPLSAQAQSRGSIAAYYERLRARVVDAGGGRFLPMAEDALLTEHNRLRDRQIVSGETMRPLARHGALDLAARAQAADMIERGYFAHAAPEGYSSVERVGLFARRFVGLAGENIVEVIGGPPASAAELTQLWQGSPRHRANMLRSGYSHVGFGVARKGERTVAAAAFGEAFAELPEPLAFRVDGVASVAQAVGVGTRVRGFALEPVGGGPSLGPFWLEDPPAQISVAGAYALKPYLDDQAMRGRFIIVDGPIIEAAG
jgi:uncharacterized protein YkwD